jgi:hypothetical protein
LLPELHTAAELLGESIFAEPLFSVAGPLRRGWVTFLYGERYCNLLAQKLCFVSQLPTSEGGLASKSVVVDAGNCFDVYFVTKLAQRFGVDTKKALKQIAISRVFNCHQLLRLITRDVYDASRESGAGVIAVLDPAESFKASDVSKTSERKLTDALAAELSDIAFRTNSVVVVSSSVTADNSTFDRMMLRSADVAVRFRDSAAGVRATLVRHPFTLRKEVLVEKGGLL